MRSTRCLALAVVLLVAANCGRDLSKISSQIQTLVGGRPAALQLSDVVWRDVRAFYLARAYAPAWVGASSVSKRAARAFELLASSSAHGLDPGRYGADALQRAAGTLAHSDCPAADRSSCESRLSAALAEFDIRLTAALLLEGRDVALGRTQPRAIDPRWKTRRTAPDIVGTLARAVDDDDALAGWLSSIAPRHPEYAALQKGLAELVAQRAQGASPALEQRIRQVALNLDRWRWLPDQLGDPHLLVNIPAFQLLIREHGAVVNNIRVVVGKPGSETPVFGATLETLVFSPYWNIPDTIVEGETAPAIAQDPDYIRRNNLEILRVSRSGAVHVDPEDVDWGDPEAIQELAFRQRPGPNNALGHVKFLFPNPYNVYLHDTPSDHLFARSGRAFSHGCVRVEEPEALARYVLRHDAAWPADRIARAMASGDEQHVKIDEPLQVHIVYFTVWPDDAGRLQFYRDIYGHDARQAATLAKR